MGNNEFQHRMAKLNFVKSKKNISASFALKCSFWETKYNGLFITDYDINNNRSLLDSDLLCLFFRYNGIHASQVFSSCLIEDEKLLFQVIEDLYKSISVKFPERIR